MSNINNLCKDDSSNNLEEEATTYVLDERERFIGKPIADWTSRDWCNISNEDDLMTMEFVESHLDEIEWDYLNVSKFGEDFLLRFSEYICDVDMEYYSKEFIIEHPEIFCSFEGKDSMTDAICSWSTKCESVMQKPVEKLAKLLENNPEALSSLEELTRDLAVCLDGFTTFTMG